MIRTKLCTPNISKNIVSRSKVAETLSLLAQYKLALISAPAGYGKTTAVVSYLETADLKYAWLSIDAADDDPVRFWNYIKASISECLKNEDALSGIKINSELVSSNITTDLLVNALSEISESLILVLDDYHLISNEAILRSVEHFIKYMPPNLRVIIISRKEPDYGLSKLFSREIAVRLTIKELAFSADETSELFAQRGISLGPDEIAALEKSTEGWVAGLVAASFAIRESGDVSTSVQAFSARNNTIDELLEHEVFRPCSDTVRGFLVQTAFLDKLSGELCAAVTGNTKSSEMLNILSETNSFIIPLDHEKTWFRYHHLFRDFLLRRLEGESESLRFSLIKPCRTMVSGKRIYSGCHRKLSDGEGI